MAAEEIASVSSWSRKSHVGSGWRAIVALGCGSLRVLGNRASGLLLLTLALPVLAVLVVAIRLTSAGAAIERQRRVGLGGRAFMMFKLRSTRRDVPSLSGAARLRREQGPEVTPLGYWLRRLHLDNLPQLFNVACGEMSLVGPRPERPDIADLLQTQIPGYCDRLRVLPGMTGLAQMNLPPDTDLQSVRRKLHLDLEYVHGAGVLLDARILLCAVLSILGTRGSTVAARLHLNPALSGVQNTPMLVGATSMQQNDSTADHGQPDGKENRTRRHPAYS